MGFGYFPDFGDSFKLADWYLRLVGYPYGSRRNEARLVFRNLQVKQQDEVLDIGCGDGIWTNDLAKRTGANVAGIDYSKHDLSIARKRARNMSLSNVIFMFSRAEKMPFEKNKFDKVFSISTFEHIQNDKKAFSEVYKVLKPGGVFVVSVPLGKTLGLVESAIKWPKWAKKWCKSTIQKADSLEEFQKLSDKKYAHLRHYEVNSLKKMLQKTGFKIIATDYHVKLFGRIPHNLVHTFSIFEWEKTTKSKYRFNNMAIFPITFFLFYPLYWLDDLIPIKNGYAVILKLKKPARN